MRTQPQAPSAPALRLNAVGTTVLYALEPRGLGTAYVESLTGYILRLAEAHVKRHLLLLHQTVLATDTSGRSGQPLPAAGLGLNGYAPAGALIASELERFTGVPTIRRTTLYGRLESLRLRSTFRRLRAWCPTCLRDDGGAPYDRLLWAFVACTVCPIHERPLVDRCAACGAQGRPLRSDARVSTCGRCGASLAHASTGQPVPIDAETQTVADLLARLETGGTITRGQIERGAAHLAKRAGSYKALRAQGFGATAVHRIVRDQTQIDFSTLVDLVRRSGDRLDVFLAHGPVQLLTRRQPPRARRGRPARLSRLARNHDAALHALREALVDPEPAAISVVRIARTHGSNTNWLRKHDPDLYQAVVTRGIEGRRARALAERQATNAAFEREARALAERHGGLTKNVLNDHLSVPGQMRDPQLRQLAQNLIEELAPSKRKVA